MASSKAIGTQFEYRMAEYLNRVLCQLDLEFYRATQSGGNKNNTSGDVVCKDETFPFYIECKYRTKKIIDVIRNKEVTGWIKHCYRELEKENKKYFLIILKFRYEKSTIFAITNYNKIKDVWSIDKTHIDKQKNKVVWIYLLPTLLTNIITHYKELKQW